MKNNIPKDVYYFFKKIYLYYGKEFPMMSHSVFWDEWEGLRKQHNHIKFLWVYCDRIYSIAYIEDHNRNIFHDEFVKLIESEVEDVD